MQMYRFAIFMGLYGLYLGNPSADSFLLLHMERTCIGVSTGVVSRVFFSWKLKTCDMLHQNIYDNSFALPHCLKGFYKAVMW